MTSAGEQAAPTHVDPVEKARLGLAALRQELLDHPVLEEIRDLADLRIFMEHHVFAVWDFMVLVKALQRSLTCLDVYWTPVADSEAARLINEIVLEEESGENGEHHSSHFELYLAAMTEAGADRSAIDGYLAGLYEGLTPQHAFRGIDAPASASAFVATTLEVAREGSLAEIVGAFAFGRETLIPELFLEIVGAVRGWAPGKLALFEEYLVRHIRIDGELHGPMAFSLMNRPAGDDAGQWEEIEKAGAQALRARNLLLEGCLQTIRSEREAARATE